MANTARSAFQTLIKLNLQGRTDLDAEINAAIDNAVEEIGQIPWTELKTRDSATQTVAGTQSISLPSDLEEILAVQLIDQSAYTSCEVNDSLDQVKVVGAIAQFTSGTQLIITAGSIGATGLSLNTEYFLRRAGGTTPNFVYTIWTTASYAAGSGSIGQVDIDDDGASDYTFLVGNGTGSHNVPYLTKSEVESLYPVADMYSNGPVAVCYREVDSLYFAPTPDNADIIRISYRANLTIASADASLITSSGFDKLVIAYATAEVMEGLELDKSATRWWRIFNRRLASKMTSQRTTGVVQGVNTRVRRFSDDPRLRDPRIVWWPDRGGGYGYR